MDATTLSKLYAVLKRMRALSKAGVPFSFEYYSYQESKGVTNGIKVVQGAVLRSGYGKAYSKKADLLIGYRADDKDRFFNLPLLIKFNNKYIDEH